MRDTRLGSEGWGLAEVIVALTVLSAGLLGAAGLVRAVSYQADQARTEADAALLAQEELEAALASPSSPPPRQDTLGFGGRDYAASIDRDEGEGLEVIRIDVVPLGPRGFGAGPAVLRSYATRLRPPLPRLAPPVPTVP